MPLTLRYALPALLACGVIAAVATLGLGSRRQARALELLRLENQALAQEVRLLEQQLEAERILAAARIRELAPAAPRSESPER